MHKVAAGRLNAMPGAPGLRPLAPLSGHSPALWCCAPRSPAGSRLCSPSVPLLHRGAAQVLHAALDRPWAQRDCRLVLEDGSVFEGTSFGAKGTEVSEVVFNTALTGYQEVMTDPSYKGQFVTFTTPHIGNTGINEDDMESAQCHLRSIIVHELSLATSNYRSTKSLAQYCEEQGVIGLTGVDTRQITRKLRDTGCLVGAISTDASKSDDELLALTKAWSIEGQDLLNVVTCTEPYEWSDPTLEEWEFNVNASPDTEPFHVVCYDFGIKHNILRRLASLGCSLTVVPATYPADKVMELKPDGIFFSNGPGDPSAAPYAVENAKALLGQAPSFGICMGHQVLGQAFGASTYKMKFGHHGANHPIRHMPSGRVEISSQNHNFAVRAEELPDNVTVSHINLNDGTCAGMVCEDLKAMTIQYHPEASPGPHDADVCFDDFVAMMTAHREAKVAA